MRRREVASFQAIHDSRAHFTRAGNFATPANAIAVLEHVLVRLDAAAALHQRQERLVHRQRLATGLPITRSVITEVAAWLIEQPSAS